MTLSRRFLTDPAVLAPLADDIAMDTERLTAAEIDSVFEAAYARYADAIYNYVYRMMGGELEAADLTQDTFVKAYMALQKNPRQYQLRPWLYRIATNVCLDELRRRGVIRWQPLEVIGGVFSFEPVEKETPEKTLLYREDVENVRRVLGMIAPNYRTVLLLREHQELSYDEICVALGKPLPAVKSLLFRAREEFRRVYLREYPEAAES